jgi:hypothetical protein
MKWISGIMVFVGVSCSAASQPVELPPIVVDTAPLVSVAQTAPQGPIRPDQGQIIPTTPTTVPATTLPDTPCAEWYPLFLETGWAVDNWPQASIILYRESRCQPQAYNNRSHDIGLWQINARSWCQPNKYNAHPAGYLGNLGLIASCDDLYDPTTNMRAALALYQYSENRNGPDMAWHPWRLTK